MRDTPFPPDYLSKESLAHRLDMKVGAIDQLVKRGILPPPVSIGEALRWRWPDVDRRIRGNGLQTTSADHGADDPYLKAINGAAPDAEHQTAAARPLRDGQG
jgi:predicted DNA-binding transcriptional regulator AlpA